MKFKSHYALVYFASLLIGSNSLADDLTIPNTFTAGTPARAADVNDNFSAVEASVDDNAQNVTDAAATLAAVSVNVDSNTTNIGNVSQAVNSLMPGPAYQFAGFTTSVAAADIGLFGMNAACQADFGATARMATTKDVVDSNISTIFQSASGWIRPIIVQAASVGTSNSNVWLVDYSGNVTDSISITCNAWTTLGGRGLVLLQDGGLRSSDRGTNRPVVCSIPQ